MARAARALRRRGRAREAQPPAPRNVNISIRIFSPGDDGDVTQVADAAERAADAVLPLAREGGARFSSTARSVRARTPDGAADTLNLTWVWGGDSAAQATPAELRAALSALDGVLPPGEGAALRQAVQRAGGAGGSPARTVLRARAAAAEKRRAARRARAARAARAARRAASTTPVVAAAPAVPAQASLPSTARRSAPAAAEPHPAGRRRGASRHAPEPDPRDAPAPPPGAPSGAGSAAGAGTGGPVSAPLSALPHAPALRLSDLSLRLPDAEVARRQEPAGGRLERPG